MKIKIETDKQKIFSFLKQNQCLFGYHIGDLDNFFFNDCKYYCLMNDQDEIIEIVLLFEGLTTSTILAFGLTENFRFLLEKVLLLEAPEKFFCHYFYDYEPVFLKNYTNNFLGSHYKMGLKKFRKCNIEASKSIKALTKEYLPELTNFYKEAYPDTYFEEFMLDTNNYYGFIEDSIEPKKILSVAGVHVFSETWRIAIIGNVATLPSHKGQGLAFQLISHLIENIITKVNYIGLNVKKDNESAINLYKKLGFTICGEYNEGFFTKK